MVPGDALGEAATPSALRHEEAKYGSTHTQQLWLPLLVLIFTQRSNTARRQMQRETWLRHSWPKAIWRYVYVQAREGNNEPTRFRGLDHMHGDTVTLAAVREGYHGLVYKVFDASRR